MRRLSRRRFVAGAVGLPIALVPARQAPAAQTPAAQAPARHEILIEGFKFRPERLTVRPGDTLRWTNKDLSPHTATAEDDSWSTGAIARGASAELVVTAGMTGGYICAFHPQMRAGLTVS